MTAQKTKATGDKSKRSVSAMARSYSKLAAPEGPGPRWVQSKDESSDEHRAKTIFLQNLRKTCNVTAAGVKAGKASITLYRWKARDPAFARAWEAAITEAVDSLEGVAYERALAGRSDRLMEMLLKAHRPERYVEKRQIDVTAKVVVAHDTVTALAAAMRQRSGVLPVELAQAAIALAGPIWIATTTPTRSLSRSVALTAYPTGASCYEL